MTQTFWTAVGAIATVVGAGVALWAVLTPSGSNVAVPKEPQKASVCASAAITECREALRVNPRSAIDACQRYADCDPNNPNAFSLLGQANRMSGRIAAAQTAYERQLVIGQTRRDESVIGAAYHNLSVVYLEQNSLDNAEFALSKSLELNLKSKNQVGQVANYKGLGDVSLKRGNLNDAESHFLKAIAIALSIDDKMGLANSYMGVGYVRIRKGDRVSGCSYFRQAREKFSDINLMRGLNEIDGHMSKNGCR